jgi:hypothetical protein
VTTEKKPSFLEVLKGTEVQVVLQRAEIAPEEDECSCGSEGCSCDDGMMIPARAKGILLDYNDSEILLREEGGGCVIISRNAVESVFPLTEDGQEDPFKSYGGE